MSAIAKFVSALNDAHSVPGRTGACKAVLGDEDIKELRTAIIDTCTSIEARKAKIAELEKEIESLPFGIQRDFVFAELNAERADLRSEQSLKRRLEEDGGAYNGQLFGVDIYVLRGVPRFYMMAPEVNIPDERLRREAVAFLKQAVDQKTEAEAKLRAALGEKS